MLDASRAHRLIAGHPVFVDHEDPSLHYVFPGPPRLVHDPAAERPELSLVMFRSQGGPSGGLLGLTTELSLEPAAHDRILRELRADGVPEPRLLVPPWRRGQARLAGWLGEEGQARWSHHVLGATQPALTPDGRALFSALLNESGAALAAGALGGGALPLVVVYTLETLGLGGKLGVVIEADVARTWERLTLEAQVESRYYARAEASAVFEQALERGEVRVRVTDESGDVEGRRATALQLAGQAFAAELFTLAAPRAAHGGLRDGTELNLELAFMLRTEAEGVRKQVSWSFEERRPWVMQHHTAASLAALWPPAAGPSVVREVDGDDPLFAHTALRVAASTSLAGAGLSALEVFVRWSEPEAEQAAPPRQLTLTGAATVGVAHLPSPVNAPWWYQVEAVPEQRGPFAPTGLSAWRRGTGQVLVVPVAELFGLRRRAVMLARIDPTWHVCAELVVQTERGEGRYRLTSAGDRVDLALPAELPTPSCFVQWVPVDGSEPLRSGPYLLDDDVLVLEPPYEPTQTIMVIPVVDQDVLLIEVQLEVVDPSGAVLSSVVEVLSAHDAAPTTLRLRRPLGATRGYRFLERRHDVDGTVHERAGTSDSAMWVVGYADQRVWTVQAVLLAGPPAARGDLATVLHLVASADQVEIDRATAVLDGQQSEAALWVRAPPDVEVVLRLYAERHRADGVERQDVPIHGGLAVVTL